MSKLFLFGFNLRQRLHGAHARQIMSRALVKGQHTVSGDVCVCTLKSLSTHRE
jgi:hypothetical protein